MAPRSLPSTPFSAPSRCLRKYSCPLPLAPSRLERHTKRLRGKFLGLSGSSHERRKAPDFSCSSAKSATSLPAASAALQTSRGLVESCEIGGGSCRERVCQ